jgi:hypothetical protein
MTQILFVWVVVALRLLRVAVGPVAIGLIENVKMSGQAATRLLVRVHWPPATLQQGIGMQCLAGRIGGWMIQGRGNLQPSFYL